jgi:hypothetical protein
MHPTAIYSKSGKGVQEASGKTNLLKRLDRAVLSAIDGRATLVDVAQKVGRTFDPSFVQLIVQLDKDGFVREVSAGTAAPAAKPGAPAAKPAAKAPAKPAATQPMDATSDLDFSALGAAKPASPPPAARPAPAAPKPDAATQARAKEQQSALNKAREEAEAKAQAERDRIKAETEAKMRVELESKARAEAEAKGDAEAKAKLEAERRAREETERRLEQERKARKETERKAREEAERARKQLEEERKAREEAERKAREEAERARKQLEEERRKLEEERKREEEERAARRKREEEEEQARRKQRKQREEEEERQAEEERAARRKQREEEQEQGAEEAEPEKPREEPKVQAKPEPKAAGGLDSLLADLDSFTQRDEEERKAGEEAERKAKAEAERRAREDAERREREEAERKAKESERSRREEEARRRKEEEERLAREQEKEQARLHEEEEHRKHEAEERARKAKEDEMLAAQATRGPAVPVGEDTDEVKRRMLGKRAAKTEHLEAPSAHRRPGSWGKPVAITLVLLLAAAIGVVHVMPIATEDYERAASEALGRPVKIGSARLSLMTGLQLHFKDVKIGDGVTIASVAGSPEFAALRGEKKIFSRIDLEGVKLPQEALGEVLFAKVKGDNFAVGRIVLKQFELAGPVPLPKPLEADLAFAPDGALRSVTLRGPDTLLARLAPKGAAIEFEVTASGFPLPVLPEVALSDFGMKGTASQRGMSIAKWGGKLLGGTLSGTANVRWGGTWSVEGLITARNINAAVFAPTLLSEGKAEGSGKFSMSGAEPSKLARAGRVEGSFTVSMGVLGSFDLARAIQSSGKTVTGRTQFAEMNGQAVYDRGAVALRNVTIGAGALNAGASVDIAQSGALSGRVVADMRTANQTLRAVLNLGGTLKEPQVRN